MQIVKRAFRTISQITVDTDLDMGPHSVKTDIVAESTEDAGVAVDGVDNKDGLVDGKDVSELIPSELGAIGSLYIEKAFSETVRHIQTGEVSCSVASYVKKRTFTLVDGFKGSARISAEIRSGDTGFFYIILTKNGVTPGEGSDLGVEQMHNTTSYVVKAQDLDLGTLPPGTTIDLWGKSHSVADSVLKNFSLAYDNATAMNVTP